MSANYMLSWGYRICEGHRTGSYAWGAADQVCPLIAIEGDRDTGCPALHVYAIKTCVDDKAIHRSQSAVYHNGTIRLLGATCIRRHVLLITLFELRRGNITWS